MHTVVLVAVAMASTTCTPSSLCPQRKGPAASLTAWVTSSPQCSRLAPPPWKKRDRITHHWACSQHTHSAWSSAQGQEGGQSRDLGRLLLHHPSREPEDGTVRSSPAQLPAAQGCSPISPDRHGQAKPSVGPTPAPSASWCPGQTQLSKVNFSAAPTWLVHTQRDSRVTVCSTALTEQSASHRSPSQVWPSATPLHLPTNLLLCLCFYLVQNVILMESPSTWPVGPPPSLSETGSASTVLLCDVATPSSGLLRPPTGCAWAGSPGRAPDWLSREQWE